MNSTDLIETDARLALVDETQNSYQTSFQLPLYETATPRKVRPAVRKPPVVTLPATPLAGSYEIQLNDAITFLSQQPDNSLDLIITDPAYSGMNQKLKLGKGKIIGTYKEKGEEGKWRGQNKQ